MCWHFQSCLISSASLSGLAHSENSLDETPSCKYLIGIMRMMRHDKRNKESMPWEQHQSDSRAAVLYIVEWRSGRRYLSWFVCSAWNSVTLCYAHKQKQVSFEFPLASPTRRMCKCYSSLLVTTLGKSKWVHLLSIVENWRKDVPQALNEDWCCLDASYCLLTDMINLCFINKDFKMKLNQEVIISHHMSQYDIWCDMTWYDTDQVCLNLQWCL